MIERDMIKYEGNIIHKGAYNYRFNHEIREVLSSKIGYVVLLDIPFNDNTLDNIYCLDENLNFKWRVESITQKYSKKKNLPYEQMSLKDNVLKATDFYGRCYIIDVTSGKILNMAIVR